MLLVAGDDFGHELDVVAAGLVEERLQGAIDDAGGEDLLPGGTPPPA
ncbi:MAG: hypothetical protein R3E12_08370 [Candidatus Eisenbacteria bacterium]